MFLFSETGVFAKKIVQCRSQFGPLIAPVKSREKAPIKVEPRDDRESPAINNNQNVNTTQKNSEIITNQQSENTSQDKERNNIVNQEGISQVTQQLHQQQLHQNEQQLNQNEHQQHQQQEAADVLSQEVNSAIEQAVQNVLESVSQSDVVSIQPLTQDSSVSLLNNSNISGQQYNTISTGQVVGPYGDNIMTSQALQNGYPQTVALTVSQDRIVNSDLTGVISHIPVNNELPVSSINSDIPVTTEHFNSEQIVADLALQASLVAGITSADALTTESIQNTTIDMIENQYQQQQQQDVTLTSQSAVECNITPQGDAVNTTLVQTSTTESAVISESVSAMTSVTENNSSNTQPETTEEQPPIVDEKFELKVSLKNI